MSLRPIQSFAAILVSMIAGTAAAQQVVPNALLTIDQNRATVIERIVGEWGDLLESSSAGISTGQLRHILSGLRSDHLLAASLAGSLDGLRDVVSGALVRTDTVVSSTLMHTKALGDTTDDLVYTPVVPCRIVDTRLTGSGAFQPSTQRDWVAFSPGGFAAQGGSATNCGIPVRPVAVMFNPTLANTVGGPEFVTFWPSGQTRPLAASVNWWGPGAQPANAQIVPLCTGGGCTADFSAFSSGQTQVIIDIVGYFNRPTNYGGTHTITGQFATDSGGQNNTASGDNSAVAGGFQNTASGNNSTVSGGFQNPAGGGLYATVAGGNNNTALGAASIVAGGSNNSAGGTLSFAAGNLADAAQNGCFVWGDASNTGTLSCAAPNEVRMRALGGFFFLTGGTAPAYSGATLPAGSGAWSALSDRSSKEHVLPVDARAVLRKLVTLPVATWNWIAQGPAARHMGPMAQDFNAAFGLGEDDKHISTVDADGVALAAIQGLHQLLVEKDRKIARLEAKASKVNVLERKLQAIEAKLGLK